jgi:plasmid stabilization system protein ParE
LTFSFHPRAEQELDKAVHYYEECSSGLGLEFAEEVYAAIARIIAYPKACMRLSKHTRRCLVNRFPFGGIFQVKATEFRIIAVANLNRKPGYWKRRVAH